MAVPDIENYISDQRLKLMKEKESLRNGNLIQSSTDLTDTKTRNRRPPSSNADKMGRQFSVSRNTEYPKDEHKITPKKLLITPDEIMKKSPPSADLVSGLWGGLGSYEEKRKRLNEERKKEYNLSLMNQIQGKTPQRVQQGRELNGKIMSLDEEYAEKFKELNPRKGYTAPTYDEMLNQKRLEEHNYRKANNPIVYNEQPSSDLRYKDSPRSDSKMSRPPINEFIANSQYKNWNKKPSPRQVYFREDVPKSTIVAEYDDLSAKMAELKMNSSDLDKYLLSKDYGTSPRQSYSNADFQSFEHLLKDNHPAYGTNQKQSFSNGDFKSFEHLLKDNHPAYGANPKQSFPNGDLKSFDHLLKENHQVKRNENASGTLLIGNRPSTSENAKRKEDYGRELKNQIKEKNRQKFKEYEEYMYSPLQDAFPSSKLPPSNHRIHQPDFSNKDSNYSTILDKKNENISSFQRNLNELSNHTSYIPSGMSGVPPHLNNIVTAPGLSSQNQSVLAQTPRFNQFNDFTNNLNFHKPNINSNFNALNQLPYQNPGLADANSLNAHIHSNTMLKSRNNLTGPKTQTQEYFPFSNYEKRNEEKNVKKKSYAEELQMQIEETKKQKRKEKEELEKYEARLEKEIMTYNPNARGGGGAPLVDNQGNTLANLRTLQAGVKDPSPMKSQVQHDVVAPPEPLRTNRDFDFKSVSNNDNLDSNESKKHGRGVSDIFLNDKSDAKKHSENKYQDELRQQIEEKKKEADRQRKREQEEELRLQKRILEDQQKMQDEVEAERKKTMEREKVAREEYEEKKRLAEAKKKEFDEKSRSESRQQPKRPQEKREVNSPRLPPPQQGNGRTSPPIPTHMVKENAQPHFAVSALKQSNNSFKPDSRPPSAQSTRRDTSRETMCEIAKLRAYLQKEREALTTNSKRAAVGPLKIENDSSSDKENQDKDSYGDRIISPSEFEIEPLSYDNSKNIDELGIPRASRPGSSASLQSAMLESESKFFDPPMNAILKPKIDNYDTPFITKPSIARRRSSTPKDVRGSVISLDIDELDQKNIEKKNKVNRLAMNNTKNGKTNDVLVDFLARMPSVRALSRQSINDDSFQ